MAIWKKDINNKQILLHPLSLWNVSMFKAMLFFLIEGVYSVDNLYYQIQMNSFIKQNEIKGNIKQYGYLYDNDYYLDVKLFISEFLFDLLT